MVDVNEIIKQIKETKEFTEFYICTIPYSYVICEFIYNYIKLEVIIDSSFNLRCYIEGQSYKITKENIINQIKFILKLYLE